MVSTSPATGSSPQATLWTVDPDEWLSTACRAAVRNLTWADCIDYLGRDEPYRSTCPEWEAGE
jgi:hypothetical protein